MIRSTRYQGESGRAYHEGKRAIPEVAFAWVSESRARKFQSQIQRCDVVLEYGVGYGWNLAALACGRKVGFDVADFLAEEVERRGIEFVKETASLPAGFADVVICHHTLEHVPNPSETLGEIRRLMKDSGRLLLVVPYERERRYRQFDPHEPNHHLYSWNPQSLGNSLIDCGMRVDSIGLNRYGYDRFAANKAANLGGAAAFRAIQEIARAARPIYEITAVAGKSA